MSVCKQLHSLVPYHVPKTYPISTTAFQYCDFYVIVVKYLSVFMSSIPFPLQIKESKYNPSSKGLEHYLSLQDSYSMLTC